MSSSTVDKKVTIVALAAMVTLETKFLKKTIPY